MTTQVLQQSPVSLFADPDLLLTSTQLAATLQVDERTLRNWRVRGDGPPWLGSSRMTRYRAAAVVEWMSGGDRG
jgi:hypothetical protein